jgi:hypothetical protein
VAASFGPAQITCQVFSASTSNSISEPMVLSATNTWSTPSLSLAPGAYIVQAIAQGTNGRSAVVYRTFHGPGPIEPSLNTATAASPWPTASSWGWGSTIQDHRDARQQDQSFLSWNTGGGSYSHLNRLPLP